MSNGFFGNGGFDANTVPPKRDFVALPAGIYNVVCMDAQWKVPKSGKGRMLVLTFEVLDGPGKSRKLFLYLNLEHESQKTVSLAQSELSSICRAIGVLRPTSEYDLINKPLKVSVYVDDDGYNGIGNYAAPGAELAEARAPKKKAKAGAPRPAAGGDGDMFDDGLPFR